MEGGDRNAQEKEEASWEEERKVASSEWSEPL